VEVHRPQVDDVMRAYVLLRETQFDAGDPRDGGGLFPGIHISNSEIGTGKARINGGLYRSVCENGLIMGWQQKESTELIHRWNAKAHMAVKINEAIASGLKMAEQAAIRFLDAQAVTLDLTKLDKIVNEIAKDVGHLDEIVITDTLLLATWNLKEFEGGKTIWPLPAAAVFLTILI